MRCGTAVESGVGPREWDGVEAAYDTACLANPRVNAGGVSGDEILDGASPREGVAHEGTGFGGDVGPQRSRPPVAVNGQGLLLPLLSTATASSVALLLYLLRKPRAATEQKKKRTLRRSANSASLAEQMRNPELCRAMPARHLVHNSDILQSSEGSEATFALSETVEQIDYFISHSWRTDAKKKERALYYYFYAKPVLAYSALIFAIYLWLLFLDPDSFTLVKWHYPVSGHAGREDWTPGDGAVAQEEPDIPPNTNYLKFGCSVLFMPFVLVLNYYLIPYLPGQLDGGKPMCFLDKCCISQTDEELKQKSITQLGSYIAKSKRMAIVLDDTYCSRLWTTFELAAFCSTHSLDKLDLLPVDLPSTVHSLMWFHIVASVAVVFGWAFTCGHELVATWLNDTLGQSLSAGGGGDHAAELVLIYWLAVSVIISLVYLFPARVLFDTVEENQKLLTTLHKQLAQFECKKLQCAVESDRAIVEGFIVQKFGDLEKFDTFVKTAVAEAVLGQGGSRKSLFLGYREGLIGEMAHMWLILEPVVVCLAEGYFLGSASASGGQNALSGEDITNARTMLPHMLMGGAMSIFVVDFFGMLLVEFVMRRLPSASAGGGGSNGRRYASFVDHGESTLSSTPSKPKTRSPEENAVRRRYICGIAVGFAMMHGVGNGFFWTPIVAAETKWPLALALLAYVAGMLAGGS